MRITLFRPGVTGRDCSRCQERHAFINRKCTLLREFVGGLAVDPSDLNILDIQGKSKYAREADAVVDEANFMGERAARAEQDILNYTTRADGISRDAQAAFKQSFNTTQFLKHFARYGGISVGAGQVELWAAEAEAHQNATIERGRYVEKRHGRVQGAKTKTDELMKKVLQLKLNDTAFEEINQRLVDVEGLVEDFRTTVNARSEVSQAREGQLLDAYDSYQKIRDSLAAAAEHANTLTNLSNSYAQLTDEYDDAYVQPSSKHAMELAKHSKRVGDAFRTTKAEAANPLKASAAYDDIVGALRNATMAVEKAQEAVTESHNLAVGSGEEEKEKGLAILVAGSQEYSTVLSGEAASIQRIWSSEDLAGKGKALKERLSLVNEQIIDMTRRKDAIRPQLENFDDQHERMGGLQQMAVETAPSSANRFHVKFRPLKGVPDAVIFSTRTKGRRTQASEYVAVEVVDRRVVAHWNIGGGKKK
ncbi:unnamed protein product, partial [Mesorhabditis spiculigera]